MIWRRIAAIVPLVLLGHLTVARAELSCAHESGHPPAPEAPQHAHHGAGTADTPPATHDEGCDHSTSQPECCYSLLSCSTSGEVTGIERLTPVALATARVAHLHPGAPTSRRVAPEPPPPRG